MDDRRSILYPSQALPIFLTPTRVAYHILLVVLRLWPASILTLTQGANVSEGHKSQEQSLRAANPFPSSPQEKSSRRLAVLPSGANLLVDTHPPNHTATSNDSGLLGLPAITKLTDPMLRGAEPDSKAQESPTDPTQSQSNTSDPIQPQTKTSDPNQPQSNTSDPIQTQSQDNTTEPTQGQDNTTDLNQPPSTKHSHAHKMEPLPARPDGEAQTTNSTSKTAVEGTKNTASNETNGGVNSTSDVSSNANPGLAEEIFCRPLNTSALTVSYHNGTNITLVGHSPGVFDITKDINGSRIEVWDHDVGLDVNCTVVLPMSKKKRPTAVDTPSSANNDSSSTSSSPQVSDPSSSSSTSTVDPAASAAAESSSLSAAEAASRSVASAASASVDAAASSSSSSPTNDTTSYEPIVVTQVISTAANQTPITITSTSSRPINGQLNGNGDGDGDSSFFSNSGAVGGTFAAVGIVALFIVAGIVWMFHRRRKNQRMDADVVAAAGAAAATTRTPFDDDDPEMIEDPSYGVGSGDGGASHGGYYDGYAPSMLSAGTGPGMAGQGAWGPAAGGAAAGAAAGYGAYNYGSSDHAGQQYYQDYPTGAHPDATGYDEANLYYNGAPSAGHGEGGPFSSAGSAGWSGGHSGSGGEGEGMPYSTFGAAGAAAAGYGASNAQQDSYGAYGGDGYGGGYPTHDRSYSNGQGQQQFDGGPPVLPNPHADSDGLLDPNVFGDPSPTESPSHETDGNGMAYSAGFDDANDAAPADEAPANRLQVRNNE